MTRQGKLYTAGLFYLLWLILIVLLCLADRQPVGAEGSVVGLATLNGAVMKLTGVWGTDGGVRMELYQLTEYLGYFAILVLCVFALLGLLQLIRRRSLRKVDRQILAMGGLFIVTLILYVFFEKWWSTAAPSSCPGRAGRRPASRPATRCW